MNGVVQGVQKGFNRLGGVGALGEWGRVGWGHGDLEIGWYRVAWGWDGMGDGWM